MQAIEILKPGPLSTVQDLGRPGWRRFAVPRSGAVDVYSLARANSLAGNPPTHAAVEVYGGGFEVRALTDLKVGWAGATGDVRLNGETRKEVDFLRTGDVFTVLPYRKGRVGYLALQGRLVAENVFGSCSTHFMAGFGGHQGRRLKAGDVLEIQPEEVRASETNVPLFSGPIRLVEGPEWAHTGLDVSPFESRTFTISPDSNRTGIRLMGEPIASTGGEMESVPVTEGTVQLTTGGQLIVLCADGPTSGGYPRIAQVIKADLPRLAQMPPGAEVRFTFVSHAEAHQIFQQLPAFIRHAYL